MDIEEPLPSPSHKKHRTPSPDDGGAEDMSNRRKHRHHHRRHHRHRHHHHIKNGREKDEGDGVTLVAKAEEASDALPMTGDAELEEGEILEEDGEKVGLEVGGGSDVESGEIKPEASNFYHNLATSGEENTFSDKDLKAVNVTNALCGENIRGNVKDLMNHDPLVRPCEIICRKIDAVPIFGDPTVTEGISPVIVGESEDSKNFWTRRDESSNKDHEVGNGELNARARSRSLVSGESLYAVKPKNREDNESKFSDHTLETYKNREDTGHSPSHRRHRGELHHRDCSRSRGTDYERGIRDDRVDRHMVRSRTSDAEMDRGHRERESSSHSKRDGREDRHGDYDRDREMDRGVRRDRERSASYSRHEGQEGRRGNCDRERDMDKGFHRERDRSSSISSRHVRDRGRERERDKGSIGDRDMEKPRDISRERYRERDRVRDVNRERERDRDGYDRDRHRIRDREVHLDNDREHGRQMERDRVSHRDKQRDSSHSKYDEWDHHRDRMRSKEFAKEASFTRHDPKEEKGESIREEDEEDYQERIEQQLAKQDEEDLDKIKEESRKRRQAILEKYKQRQSQQHVESPSNDHHKEDEASMAKDKLQEVDAKIAVGQAVLRGPEMRQDFSDFYVVEPSFTVGKSPIQNGTSTPERRAGAQGLGEGTPKSERSADMFCDDIFGESPIGVRKSSKGDGLQIDRSGLHDNWDDAEGYYSYRFGEVLDGRYEVIAAHGKGVFSTVVRAKDLKAGKGDPEEVAIKIIRNNDTMYKAGLEELIILKKLAGADPEDKRHCVRFLSSFKYRKHLSLVFESLHMNLREVLKKFGRNIGLRLTAVRAYAKQLFIALKHLRNCGILHCDIKPDNMLVNETKNILKLCDFGNAMFAGKNEITPYLVSRFYRAPEIILGLPYDHPMDMWSVGCCLYEVYTGKVLFPGPSNNDMLRLHMELKGSFPKKMLRKGAFTDQHFDQDLNFHATEEDPVTRKTVKRLLLNIKPKDISALISSSPGDDPKMLANFEDLLERIFVLDPEKRMTVSQALSHPFITGK